MRFGWAICIVRVSHAGRAHRRGEESRAGGALSGRASFKPLDASAIFREYSAYAERLRPYVCDTTELLLSAVESGKRILFEGAQGSLLDVDHGTYPFVTSSNSSGVGIAAVRVCRRSTWISALAS